MFSAASYFKSHEMSCRTEGEIQIPAGRISLQDEWLHRRDRPEFVSGEDDPSLEQQRPQHPEEQPQTQTGEQTLKVHMLQA